MSFVYGLLFWLALTPITRNPDQLRFAELLQQANAGDARAQLWVGVAYQRGIGVKRDESTAVAWFLRSASAGNPDAQNSLGQSYADPGSTAITRKLQGGIARHVRTDLTSAVPGKAATILGCSIFTGGVYPRIMLWHTFTPEKDEIKSRLSCVEHT